MAQRESLADRESRVPVGERYRTRAGAVRSSEAFCRFPKTSGPTRDDHLHPAITATPGKQDPPFSWAWQRRLRRAAVSMLQIRVGSPVTTKSWCTSPANCNQLGERNHFAQQLNGKIEPVHFRSDPKTIPINPSLGPAPLRVSGILSSVGQAEGCVGRAGSLSHPSVLPVS